MDAGALYEEPMSMENMSPLAKGPRRLSPARAMMLPGVFIAGLIALALYLGPTEVVGLSVLGAGGLLLVWAVALFVTAARSKRTLLVEVTLFKDHWVQACTQVVIYAFWAWYVPEIRGYWPLLLAQLLFAYGFHILLTWSRRDHYGLGFGPVPITGSFNLFILFRPEWFYWQFGIVAAAFLGKELIRWERDGRSTHVFNPSSFGLVVFSAALILSGSTDMTFGVEIPSWLTFASRVYLVLFLVSIPVQLFFGVATMTVAAFVTTYLFGLAYLGVTGTYFFFDAYIPVAVFVGMLLLITDPATAPRSELGILLTTLIDDPSEVRGTLNRGCDLGFPQACANLQRVVNGDGALESARPLASDLPILLRGNKGPLEERSLSEYYALACERGFRDTCDGFVS